MRANVSILRLAIIAILAAPGPIWAQVAGEGSVSLPYGSVAPGAALQDLEGNSVDLIDYIKGKPALIEFWASWCEQCEVLQPQLDRIQAEHGEQIKIVAVAVGVAQSLRRVKRHFEDHNPGYPYLYDARGAAVRAYNAQTTSIVVMLDSDGKVVYTGVGTSQDLVGAAQELLRR